MRNQLKPLLVATAAFALAAPAQSLKGLWDAKITTNGVEIPFRFEFSDDGDALKGSFFNGDERVVSTSGSVRDGHIRLSFNHYATKLDAVIENDVIDGIYGREDRLYFFHAARHQPSTPQTGNVPSIAGLWEIPVASAKGEKAWQLIVRQNGGDVSAAILRIDGDTGTLAGSYRDGSFLLSHFSGARPNLLLVTPQADGSLALLQNGKTKYTAIRAAEARAKSLPAPDDPMKHTTVRNPNEPLAFNFPDLAGKLVSNSDARFRGKVVIVSIGGSWCPNCHDEAPFLQELYKKYGSQGLEVVELSFEEGEQLKNPERLRAFIKEYRIEYPVLLAGEPSELAAKLPQAVNLNAWPTTFFIGRDGLVRGSHTGFAGRASGELHDQMVEELNATLARLLCEDTVSSVR